MPDLQLASVAQLSLETTTDLLNAVYADYAVPVQRSVAQIAAGHAAWDIEPALSVAALMDGAPVGIVLLARRQGRGWIGSMGVAPAWRRQGIGRRLLQQALDNARTAGLRQVQLEVLTRNAPAIALYQAAGFQITRELLVWERLATQGALPAPAVKPQIMQAAWALERAAAWHTVAPCWQREAASFKDVADVQALAVANESGEPQAYLLMRPPQGARLRLLDLGAAPGVEPRRLGRDLLQGLHLRFFGLTAALVNEPVESAWNHVLAALGYYVIERQHEMHWRAA